MEHSQRKQRNKGFLAGAIVCIFFGVFSLCGAVFIPQPLVTVEETEEYLGTIDAVEKREKDFLISLDDWSIKLLISHEIIIGNDVFNTLKSGDKIYFRLFKWEWDIIQQGRVTQFVPRSLRTEKADIYTLENYNEHIKNSTIKGKIALGCVSGVLFIGATVFLVLYIRKTNQNAKETLNQKQENGVSSKEVNENHELKKKF